MNTKNILFLSALFVFASAKAQLSLGIKAGVNFPTDAKIEDIGDPSKNIEGDGSNGFHIGILSRISIPLLSIRPEIVYTQITQKNSLSKVTTQKIDIPILVEKSFFGLANIHLGPSFQYVLGNDFDTDKLKKVEATDFSVGFVVGIGVKLKKIGVDLRYETGLHDSNLVLQEVSESTKYQLDNRNKQIILSVYYNFL